MNRLKKWWQKSTMNEKLMYALIVILLIGISTRWRYVFNEIGGAFTGLFLSEAPVGSVNANIKAPKLMIPEVPTVMQGTVEGVNWLSLHFWDNANFRDTAYLKYPSVMETALSQWGEVLLAVNDSTAHRAVRIFMDRASVDSSVLGLAIEKVEWAFYDPNSSIRNFEAYIAALQWMTASDKLTDLQKIRPTAQLENVLKNRKGTRANDFKYVTLNGGAGTLYGIKTPYTLVFINNPACPACRDYKDYMKQSETIGKLVGQKKLTILGVVPDDEYKLWLDRADQFPSQWINGYDQGQTIKKQRLYELNVIPTMLLLDNNKTVLLKDARPPQVEQYFKDNKL